MIEYKTDFVQDNNKYSLFCDFNDSEEVEERLASMEDIKDFSLGRILLMGFGAFITILSLSCILEQEDSNWALFILIIGIVLVGVSVRRLNRYSEAYHKLSELSQESYRYIKQVSGSICRQDNVRFFDGCAGYATLCDQMDYNTYLPVRLLKKDSLLKDNVVLIKGFLENDDYDVQILVNEETYNRIAGMFK